MTVSQTPELTRRASKPNRATLARGELRRHGLASALPAFSKLVRPSTRLTLEAGGGLARSPIYGQRSVACGEKAGGCRKAETGDRGRVSPRLSA